MSGTTCIRIQQNLHISKIRKLFEWLSLAFIYLYCFKVRIYRKPYKFVFKWLISTKILSKSIRRQVNYHHKGAWRVFFGDLSPPVSIFRLGMIIAEGSRHECKLKTGANIIETLRSVIKQPGIVRSVSECEHIKVSRNSDMKLNCSLVRPRIPLCEAACRNFDRWQLAHLVGFISWR